MEDEGSSNNKSLLIFIILGILNIRNANGIKCIRFITTTTIHPSFTSALKCNEADIMIIDIGLAETDHCCIIILEKCESGNFRR